MLVRLMYCSRAAQGVDGEELALLLRQESFNFRDIRPRFFREFFRCQLPILFQMFIYVTRPPVVRSQRGAQIALVLRELLTQELGRTERRRSGVGRVDAVLLRGCGHELERPGCALR